MAPHVHKKIASATVLAAHETQRRPNGILKDRENEPYVLSVKLGQVTAIYWGEKGTLMSQGPEEPATRLGEEFFLSFAIRKREKTHE